MKTSAPEMMTSSEALHQKHISSETDRSEASKGCSKDLITPYHCLHYSALSLQQEKNNSYACTSVSPYLEWI